MNPAILLLTTRRGEIDCGGLDHIIVGYGNFHQLIVPIEDGHLSVAIERNADPRAFIAPVHRLIAEYGAGGLGAKSSSASPPENPYLNKVDQDSRLGSI